MPQKFRFVHSLSDPDFYNTEVCRHAEFIRDIGDGFNRKILLMSTTNDKWVVTLDEDIPDSEHFDPVYYGLERF